MELHFPQLKIEKAITKDLEKEFSIILDGALLSECEMMGSNRYGMLRVAESMTAELIKHRDVGISFANTMYNDFYDNNLRKFISDNYPSYNEQILTKKPIPIARGRRLIVKLLDHLPKPVGNKIVKKYDSLLSRFNNFLSINAKIKQIGEKDIFHSFFHPFSQNIERRKIKKTITYHDIFALRLKGYPVELNQRIKRVIESIVPNFAISVSEFSRQDLLDYDKRIDPDRIFVSPLAASRELFFQNKNKDEWKTVKNKYKLPDRYFLSLCSDDPRKNVRHLIRSFSKFVLQERPKDLFLVLAGNTAQSPLMLDELKIDKTVREKIFIPERYIDDEDLAPVYSNAQCFFYMSYYEGFGLPALEAMQCGTPVVTANATSLPEVVGKAGIMLPPADEDALADIMNQMFQSERLREKYSRLGLSRSEQFSWQRAAGEYTKIFKNIVSNY